MKDNIRIGLGYCGFWIAVIILYVIAGFIFIMNVGVLSSYATFMLQEVKPAIDDGGDLSQNQIAEVLSFGKELKGVLFFLPLFLVVVLGLYSLLRTAKEAYILGWWKRYWYSFGYYLLSSILFSAIMVTFLILMISPVLLLSFFLLSILIMYIQGIVSSLLLIHKMDVVWSKIVTLKKLLLYTAIYVLITIFATLLFGVALMAHWILGVLVVMIYLSGYLFKQQKHYVLLKKVR